MTEQQWEYFQDPNYYMLWAIRPKGKERFEDAIHVRTHDEAKLVADRFNELEKLKDKIF